MEKLIVDENRCIGCGACVAIANNNFDFNDEGLSIVKDENVTDEAREALETCPVDAIKISD